MMRKWWTAIAAIGCMVLFTQATFGQTSKNNLDRILEQSGLLEQIAQIVPLMESGIEQAASASQMPAESVDQMKQAVITAFAKEKLDRDVRSALQAELSDEDATRVLQWLDSPTGREITRMEVSTSTPEGSAASEKAAPTLYASLSESRKQKLATLAEVVKAAESTADTALDVASAMAYGMNLAMPDSPHYSLEQIRALVEKNRSRVIERYRTKVVTSFAFTYRNLSDQALEAYISFSSSPAGQRYTAAIYDALRKAMSTASIELGTLLAPKDKPTHNG